MLRDSFGRPITDLRLSVTDRCNFQCVYCKPQLEGRWVDRRELLTFEELERLAGILVSLGIEKIRITGGEPLVRQDVEHLIARLARIEGVRDLCMTTNAYILADKVDVLRQAARRDGMKSLQEEGVLLVAKGVTSLPELMRVLKQ